MQKYTEHHRCLDDNKQLLHTRVYIVASLAIAVDSRKQNHLACTSMPHTESVHEARKAIQNWSRDRYVGD